MRRSWEVYYPLILAVLSALIIFLFKWDLSDIQNFSSILNATVTLSAIVIAFLGTMLSILITITNSEVMDRIKQNDAEGDLTSYIKVAVVSGFILALYSMILNIFVDNNGIFSRLLLCLFASLVLFFVLSSYRIIIIFSNILEALLIVGKTEAKAKKKKVFRPQMNDD